MKPKGRKKENMINNKKDGSPSYYEKIIGFVTSDKFDKKLKLIFKNEYFEWLLKRNRKYFTAPIQNLYQCFHKHKSPLTKYYFKSKEFKNDLKLSFVIYKIMKDALEFSGNFRFLNQVVHKLSDSPLFPEDFPLTKIIKENQGTILTQKEWNEKLFYSSEQYTDYLIYFETLWLGDISEIQLKDFLFNLYQSKSGVNKLAWFRNINANDYLGDNFKFSNFTRFNKYVLNDSEEIYLNLFTKLAPYYYGYLSGIVSEKDFHSVVVPEMREYILAQIKYRICEGFQLKEKSKNIYYYFDYLKFGDGKYPKFAIDEFPDSEQKHILKLLQKSQDSNLKIKNFDLMNYLKNKFKGE